MRIHGRGGVAYMSRLSGDPASPVAFLSDWAVDYARTVFDVTSIVDTQHAYASGQPDVSGTFTGFYDTATVQSYQAAVDGQPRDLFLYPAIANTGQFFSGPVLPDYKIGGGVTSAVALSVTWSATGTFTRTSIPAGSAFAGLATAAGTVQQPAITGTTTGRFLIGRSRVGSADVLGGSGTYGAVYAAVYA